MNSAKIHDGGSKRHSDIDWLRVLCMLLIFFLHNARFFDFLDWHVKDNNQNMVAMLFLGFLHQWIMPMFFLLSGIGSWFALEKRTWGMYVKNRVKRLLIPYYIVGLLILAPPQFYLELLTHNRLPDKITILRFIKIYLQTLHYGLDHHLLSYWGGHLWFLRFLFVISLITLPVMLFLKRERGRHFISKLAGICEKKGGIFLMVIPIFLIQITMRAHWPEYLQLTDFFCFVVFFLIGYIIYADKRFTNTINRHWIINLILGTTIFIILIYLIFPVGFIDEWEYNPSYTPEYIFYQTMRSINTWCWIAFVLFLGNRFFNFSSNTLKYCNEAVLPFYILHQTIILLIGFFVVRWNMGIILKYLLILISSFIMIMSLYELVIRRNNIIRFLFGMKKL